MASASVDRRSAQRLRHRAAILEAARVLIGERGAARFSVDELAERADVARRTVFNHFASSSGVVLALAEEVIDERVQRLVASSSTHHGGRDDRSAMFEDVAHALRASDLASAIVALEPMLLGFDDMRTRSLFTEAFTRVTTGFREELVRAYPEADPLDADLLLSSLFSGVTVIARRWVGGNTGAPDEERRAEWDALLTTCIERVRIGYASDLPAPHV